MNYRYEALSRAGVIKNGLMQAPSLAAARDKVYRQGYDILAVSPAFSFNLSRTLKNRVLKEFFTDLGVLLDTGMTLADALEVIESTTTDAVVVKAARRIMGNLEKGYTLAKSLEATQLFPEMAISTVHIGETAGTLPKTMANLGIYYEEKDLFVTAIRRSLIYPAFILVGALGFMGIAGFWVLPRLAPFLEGLPLPLPTRVILAISGGLRSYWYVGLGSFLGTIAAGYFSWHFLRESQLAQSFYEKTRIGRILKEIVFSTLFLNLSTLHYNGIPLTEAISLVADSVSHYIAGYLGKTRELLEKGLSFSDALTRQNIFPTFIIQTVKKGEAAGELEDYLQQVSAFYLRRTKRNMEMLAQFIQPVLLLGLGGMVLFTMLSILVPVYGNLNTLGSQIK